MEGAREEKYRILLKNLWGRVVIWNIYSIEWKIMLNGSEENRVWTHELD
jgi:hypothetical protein